MCFNHTIPLDTSLDIRQIRQVRSSLDINSAIILANSLVSSKLDYCNYPDSYVIRRIGN